MVRGELDILKATVPLLLTATVLLSNSAKSDGLTAQDYAEKGLESATFFPGLASLCDISREPRNMFQSGVSKDTRPERRAANTPSLTEQRKASKGNTNRRARRHIPPQKVFDNLYYVGAGNVASWAIDTGKTIVLVDALNSDEQAGKYIFAGLKTLGLEDKPVSHLIISHGHGDHYGGFNAVVKRFNPRIVMSELEWELLEHDSFASRRWGAKPKKDMAVNDGDTLNIDGTTLTFHVTPGHTPGTLSLVFPVYDGDEPHRAVLWGGTGLNYGSDVQRIQSYTESAQIMKGYVEAQNIDVFLSNHPGRDGSREKLLASRLDNAAEKHAFVQGKNIVKEAFELLENCTRAQWMNIVENKSKGS